MDHGDSTRRRTGGRRKPASDRKKHQIGGEATETTLDETRLKTVRTRGGTTKVRTLQTDVVNVADGDETVQADIENVVENEANPNYARRNIITKGAILETSEGRARVTSRPGQNGQVDAVLVE